MCVCVETVVCGDCSVYRVELEIQGRGGGRGRGWRLTEGTPLLVVVVMVMVVLVMVVMVASRSIFNHVDRLKLQEKQKIYVTHVVSTLFPSCFQVASTLPARYARGSDKRVERAHVQMMYSCVVCVRGGEGWGVVCVQLQ